MNHFKYNNLPMYAPNAGGGAGGGSFENLETPLDQIGDDSTAVDQGQNQNQDDLSVDPDAVLAALWGSDGEGDDDPESTDDEAELNDDGTPKKPVKTAKKTPAADDDDSQPNANAQALADQLAKDLKALTVPADFLPENFDPSNREQLASAFSRAQQHGASNTLRLFFPIMDRALKAQRASILQEVGTQLNTNTSESRIQVMLESAIPEAADAALGPIVKTIFKQARGRHEKPAAAIAATKKALAAIGVKLGGTGDSLPAGVTRQRANAGGAANMLDQFFQIPAQGNAATRRMKASR